MTVTPNSKCKLINNGSPLKNLDGSKFNVKKLQISKKLSMFPL